jgi:hypothetical protein
MSLAGLDGKWPETQFHLTKKRMEPGGSGATWTEGPKGVFAKRKYHKPRLALNDFTAGVRERQDANRTRVAGHLDEIQGVAASTLRLFRAGAVGFIDWLDVLACQQHDNAAPSRDMTCSGDA